MCNKTAGQSNHESGGEEKQAVMVLARLGKRRTKDSSKANFIWARP